MYSSALKFWDDILGHMVFLVRRGVMEPETVAAKFAPLLVSPESQAVDKVSTQQCHSFPSFAFSLLFNYYSYTQVLSGAITIHNAKAFPV